MAADLRLGATNSPVTNPAEAGAKPRTPRTTAGFAGFGNLRENPNPARSINGFPEVAPSAAGFAVCAGFGFAVGEGLRCRPVPATAPRVLRSVTRVRGVR